MNLRKLIREEMSDFDWTTSDDANINSDTNRGYVINLCRNGFLKNQVRKKLASMYGDDFTNSRTKQHVKPKHLIFVDVEGGVDFSWAPCNEFDDGEGVFSDIKSRNKYYVNMTPQEFLRDNDLNESEFDWVDSWVTDTPTVGQEYYYDYGMGEPVLVRVVGVINDIVRFKNLDDDFISSHREMFYDEEYGWDVIDSIHLDSFMKQSKKAGLNESEFEWAKETPIDPITVGERFKTPNGSILRITKVDSPNPTSEMGEPMVIVWWNGRDVDGDLVVGSDRYDAVKKRFDDGVWTHVNEPITESEFDWTDEIGEGLTIDQTYEVTADNGYKYLTVYCGRGTITHPDTKQKIEGHKFRDVDSDRCNSWWSEGNLLNHIKDGRIVLQNTVNESDFEWMEKVKSRPIQIGGMVISIRRPNEGEIPVDYVGIGDKVRTRPTTDHPDGFVFTIEDVREENGRVGVWGSDIPEKKKWKGFGRQVGEKNYHFTHALVRESIETR